MMAAQGPLARLADARVIAVIRAPTSGAAVRAATAVIAGGIRAVEISFTTPEAGAAIAETRRSHGGEAAIGAGTVCGSEQVERALDAGAEFLVSPGLVDAVTAAAAGADAAYVPGALTPTEVIRARAAGADAVKLFPASLAGPPLLRALREPFPDVNFVPTGGVTPSNVGEWLAAGAIAVGAGGALCPPGEIAAGEFDRIRARAERFRAAVADRG